MREERLRATAKKVQKITRDGAIEKNLADESSKRTSKRVADVQLKVKGFEEKGKPVKIEEVKKKGKPRPQVRRQRLKFTQDESVKQENTKGNTKKGNTKKGKTSNKANQKKRLYQEETKKRVSKLHVEEVAFSAKKVISKGQENVIGKDDNIAKQELKAGEQVASSAFRLNRRRRDSKQAGAYQKTPKLKERVSGARADIKQGTTKDNVTGGANRAKNFWQKQQIKRQYAKAKRAEKAGESVGKRAFALFKEKGRKAAQYFAKPKTIITIATTIIVSALLMSSLTTCSSSMLQATEITMAASYLADVEDIEKAELYYTELEAALQKRINELEGEYPGLDEYRYNIGEITHDPHVLISYLSAKYEAFTFEQVKDELDSLFEAQYGVDIEQVTETREETRTVQVGESLGNVVTSGYCNCVICCGIWSGGPTASGVMPRGNHTIAVDSSTPFLPQGTKVVMNGREYTVEDTGPLSRYGVTFDVYYDNHATASAHGHQTWEAFLAEGNANTVEVTKTETLEVLNTTVTAKPLRSVVMDRLDDGQKEFYELIYSTRGNLQVYKAPSTLNWYAYVKNGYGYSINASTGQRELYKGVNIVISDGTEIKAGKKGTIVDVGYTNSYGTYVVLEDEKGYQLKYAHLSSASVVSGQEVAVDDVVGISSNQLYLELVKDGEHYNPIFYVDTGEVGFSGGASYDDETVQRLFEEAEKYLGMPYVWGGSSPSTSFDCSGFVSFVFTNSGVYNIGRATAQGIYDMCEPISPEEAKPGDIIFFTGTYNSSGPVSHVGIYAGDGQMIHCGNPIQYANIYSSYWQQHFYSFGRLR